MRMYSFRCSYRYLFLLFLFLQVPLLAEAIDSKAFVYDASMLDLKMKDAEKYSVYRYPYGDLAALLEEKGQDTIKIFSYGSLMDYQSASRTLSKTTLATRKPWIAFGIKRIFNRDVSIKKDSHWGQPRHPASRGMLNVKLTKEIHDMVNGVGIEVPTHEISNILSREVGYNLIPVVCIEWHSAFLARDPKYFIAYTFSAGTPGDYTNSEIYPRPKYYETAREAAKQYGPIYYHLWMNTTYMADSSTPITEWEESIRKGEGRTQTKD